MRKLSGDVWGLIGLITLFGVMAFVIAGRTPQMAEGTPHRTTYSNQIGGFRAAYLLLRQRGVLSRRLDTPPGDWPKVIQVVITSTPYNDAPEWSKQSAKAALGWVEAGNTLIIASDVENDLTRALKLTFSDKGEVNGTVMPRQPLPLLRGVKTVSLPDTKRWSRPPARGVTLLAGKMRGKPRSALGETSELPALIVMARGKGQVLALSSPAVFENRMLDEADNARFLVQLVESQLPAGSVLGWDEYHQGFAEGETFWTVIGVPGQLVIYQIVAISLLAVYAASRRFGLPRPAPAASRVSSEYVTSLADLYRRARASDAALLGVYTAFRRDLCRTLGVATDLDDALLARQAANLADPVSRRETEEKLRRLLSDCALWTTDQSQQPRREQNPLPDAEMLRLAREMEMFRKDLGIGRTR